MTDIRWEQRFENYQKALTRLNDLAAQLSLSDAERAGFIQYFEITIELGWKVLKDWLIYEKFATVSSPREVIKAAFEAAIISDGHTWIDALEARNITVHTYDEQKALDAEFGIRHRYLPIFLDLQNELRNRLSR
jgi:nucleotidyltransferase substrate binding protein (TIGR01987 family)